MPEMIPVGNTGIQPDALGSISKMIGLRSGMIGLQQQQQALQTGAYGQQSAQAKAQVDTQQAQQFQALGNFTKSAINSPDYFDNKDPNTGNFLADKFRRDASMVAPNRQTDIAEALADANQAVTNKKAVLSLNVDQQKRAAGFAAALAGKTDATPQDANDTADMIRSIDPGNKLLNDAANNMLQHFGTAKSSSDRQQIASGVASLLAGQSPLASATNAAGQFQTQNTLTTARTQTPTGEGVTNPTTPQIAGQAARQTGTAGSDIEQANQISANTKAAPATIQTSQQIDDLADQIHSGKFVAAISKAAAAVGMKEDTYARQLLEKDLGIIKTQLTAAASSDARAGTILSGTPDATSDPQTIHGAMDYVRGAARQNLAQSQNLNAYRAKHPDLSGFQQADNTFTGAAGPLVHEFLSLKPGSQRQAFFSRNFSDPQKALEFRNKALAASHVLGLDNANR
jgi:hypothetical protein